jgi:hypothetical protein
LKLRDGGVDGVLLLLPDSRRTREFLRAGGDGLRTLLPLDGRRALELLGAGVDPGGNAIIVLPIGRERAAGGPVVLRPAHEVDGRGNRGRESAPLRAARGNRMES